MNWNWCPLFKKRSFCQLQAVPLHRSNSKNTNKLIIKWVFHFTTTKRLFWQAQSLSSSFLENSIQSIGLILYHGFLLYRPIFPGVFHDSILVGFTVTIQCFGNYVSD